MAMTRLENCQEMPKNQVVSLPRSGRVPDMAYTSCPQMPENQAAPPTATRRRPGRGINTVPKKSQKCLKIRLRPYRGPDASRHGLHNVSQKLPRNA
ncbi:Hypothetical predicted protein [Olea europaea subsp. europaea]|uniref:Uncharacterized protein n=1 Tax=Olea europaea subsp. europaea TaxID=158383 RepID=A0A8S0SZY2_OLEEU|nr:Hypothetical predicted protein [Olea europaea subsp. europaea]